MVNIAILKFIIITLERLAITKNTSKFLAR